MSTRRRLRFRAAPAALVAAAAAFVALLVGLLVLTQTPKRVSASASGPAASMPSRSAVAFASVTPAAPPDPRTTPAPVAVSAPARLSVVALGDSVPSGYACHCRSYVDLVGDGLRLDGARVTVRNLAAAGATATGLSHQLATSSGMRRDVAGADVVLVEVGANDLAGTRASLDDDECPEGGTGCYDAALGRMREALSDVLSQVADLRGGRPTTVLVLDYWAVFEDGVVARSQTGQGGLRTDDAVTLRANADICAAARAAADTCVDVRPAFREADGSADATPLLAADGDHPNAAGHRALADAVLEVLRPLLAAR